VNSAKSSAAFSQMKKASEIEQPAPQAEVATSSTEDEGSEVPF
jgi:hypothetical protein